MTSKAYENQKRVLNYSKTRVEKAGRDIRHGCEGKVREESIAIIQNFREVHLYPLMLIKNHLLRTVKKISKRAIVARRLKRLPTIIDKLERPTLDGKEVNAIQLTRMQDIGGCRAIVPNLTQVNELHDRLKNSNSIHKIIKTYNYLSPKESGYGGIHLVYSCFLGSEEENEWKKIKIEVQLRTILQHAWATSLEIIDTLENVKLKTSMEGHQKWRRFFQVAGRLVAHKEKACEIEGKELPGLIGELINLEKELQVIKKLFQYQLAINVITDNTNMPVKLRVHQGMFLVTVMNGAFEEKDEEVSIAVRLAAFSPKNTEKAFSELAANEADSDVMIAVLVSANDVRNLKKAYPNYFGDTVGFVHFLNGYIQPKKKKSKKKSKKKRKRKRKNKARRKNK